MCCKINISLNPQQITAVGYRVRGLDSRQVYSLINIGARSGLYNRPNRRLGQMNKDVIAYTPQVECYINDSC